MDLDIKHARNQRLKDIFGYNTNFIIILSFITLFCLLFFCAWYLLKYLTDYTILAEYNSSQGNTEAQDLVISKLYGNHMLFGLIFVPIAVVTFVLYGGCKHLVTSKMFRQWNGYKQFFAGVNRNFKYSIVAGIVCAFWYNTCNILQWSPNIYLQILYYCLLFLYVLVIYPVTMIFITEGEVYQGKISRAIKNAFVLYFADWYVTCPIYVLCALPIAVVFIFDTVSWSYVLFGALMVYGFGMLEVLESGYVLSLLDKYVNKQNYQNLYLLGFEKESKDA